MKKRSYSLVCGAAVGLWMRVLAGTAAPLADVHLHYKWNQAEVTSAEQAIAILEASDVELAVVMGTPPELALELQALDPQRVIPIFGPYRTSGEWYRWQGRPELLEEARQALASGRYRGIGELHLIGGFTPAWEDNQVLRGLVRLAAEFDVPLLLHSEYSRPDPILAMCRENPQTRFLLAHAGTVLKPAQVARILATCPNLWVELSARDPWRYTGFPVADANGRLLAEWEALVLAHPDRFMIGSDPVWPVDQIDRWDEPDTGWQRLGDFLAFHRRWTSFLPQEVSDRVLRGNARALFGAERLGSGSGPARPK